MIKAVIEIRSKEHCDELISLMEDKIKITKQIIASYIKELHSEVDGLRELQKQKEAIQKEFYAKE
jgi:hypothetical protein